MAEPSVQPLIYSKLKILTLLVRLIRILAWLIQPYLPTTSAQLTYLLGCPLENQAGLYNISDYATEVDQIWDWDNAVKLIEENEK